MNPSKCLPLEASSCVSGTQKKCINRESVKFSALFFLNNMYISAFMG